ncbi:Endonuclease-reverse transcriptase [Popillia japonica]|uniref:Endonuclease-reverse transcriptase n=1 Tax=Popillia japonica TaxID=7064 RepID=A0AAW1L7J7_POPJA
MEAFDVVGLVETWMQEDEWKEGENLLPKVFKWKKQWAKREKERGRASGGILMGVRDSINEVTRANREGREGALETTGGANGDRKVIIGGDWNAKTGIMGDPYPTLMSGETKS